jgi:colanic acid/amylovoran biosynthesis glycosyltransferase
LWTGIGHIKRGLSKQPVSTIKSLNFFKLKKSALSLSALYWLVAFNESGPYDIVHCHFGPNGKVGLHLRNIGAVDGKIVVAFHGYDLTMYLKQNGEGTYAEVFKHADLIMPISHLWENRLTQLGCSRKKIIVHRMGIDTDRYRSPQKRRNKDSQCRLVSVARFVEKKGLEYSIEAVAQLLKSQDNILYNIVGDGELHRKYADIISNHNVGDKIQLLGWKKSEEVINIMGESDILIAPSITSQKGDQEGIPVVIMEAMALGKAVISTKHSGIPELVADGLTGFLVNERSVEELKEKILFFIKHPGKMKDMGAEGRKIAEKEYDINQLNDKLIDIYKILLQK